MPPTMQIKRGTAAALASVNPTPLAGELVWDSTNNTLRVGNGSSAYSSLAIVSATPSSHTHAASDITSGTLDAARIANDSITYAKLQNVSATDRLLGRSSAGAGDVEEITCTATGRAIIGAASEAAARSAISVQPTASPAFTGAATVTNDGNVVPLTVTNTGTANSFVVNDESGDTTPFVIDAAGRVVIGATSAFSDAHKFAILGGLPSASGVSVAFIVRASIPSSTTSNYISYFSNVQTDAASFTLASLEHYAANQQGTFSAGSSVTSQYGFVARSSLTGATNNYGFYSDIASGTGRWNFYANGTAANYFAGPTTIASPLTLTGTVAGNVRQIKMQTSGVDRWQITPGFDSESGSNAGSTLWITRWSDAGAFLGTPIAISRATGSVTLENPLFVPAGSVSACGVAFSGDTNTGLAQIGGADTASLVTAGVERVRCTSGGTIEVRANSGSISHGLTYNENGGEIILYDETQTAATLIDQISTDTRVLELVNGSNLKLGLGGSNTTGLIQFMRAGYQEAMRIDASGNVGIGNIVPAYRFEVRGAGAQARFYNSTTDAVVYIQGLTHTSPWFGAGKSACQIDVDGWGGFAWQTDVTSGAKLFKLISNGGYGAGESTFLTVNASGNIGIGVAPTHRLDCNGEFRLRGTGASTEAGKLHLYWVSSTNRATWTTDASGNALLETGSSSPAERFRVGVNGRSQFFAASEKYGVQLNNGSTANGPFIGSDGADILTISTSGGAERMRVKATGSVRFVPLSADPSTGNEAGDVYYNSSTNKLRVYNGTSWVDLH